MIPLAPLSSIPPLSPLSRPANINTAHHAHAVQVASMPTASTMLLRLWASLWTSKHRRLLAHPHHHHPHPAHPHPHHHRLLAHRHQGRQPSHSIPRYIPPTPHTGRSSPLTRRLWATLLLTHQSTLRQEATLLLAPQVTPRRFPPTRSTRPCIHPNLRPLHSPLLLFSFPHRHRHLLLILLPLGLNPLHHHHPLLPLLLPLGLHPALPLLPLFLPLLSL